MYTCVPSSRAGTCIAGPATHTHARHSAIDDCPPPALDDIRRRPSSGDSLTVETLTGPTQMRTEPKASRGYANSDTSNTPQ